MTAKIPSKVELEESFKELLKNNEYEANRFFYNKYVKNSNYLFVMSWKISISDYDNMIDGAQSINVFYNNNRDGEDYFEVRYFSDESLTPIITYKSIKDDEKFKIIEEDEDRLIVEYGSYPQTKIINPDIFNNLVMKFHTAILEEVGEFTFKIYKDGKKDKAKKYRDKETGKEYAFVTEKEDVLYFSIEDMTVDDLTRINCTCGEFLPIKWIVNKKTGLMLPLTGLIISENFGEYRTSKLREYLESGEFFADIGVASFEKVEERKTTMPWGKKEESKSQSLSDEIKRVLMGSHRIPYLVGHPGIGKTAIAKSINKNYLTYNISTFTPDRFTGKTALIPGKVKNTIDENGISYSETISAGTTSVALPDWYNDLIEMSNSCAKNNERCILFFDEFDKLTPNMQVFINGVVDTPRTIANLVIPDNVDIVFAGNTEEYSDASFNISGEVESRLTRIDVKTDWKAWLSWAIKNDVDPLVRAYILSYKDSVLIQDVVDNTGKYDYTKSLTPRSWEQKISEEIKISRKLGEYPKLSFYMSSDAEKKFEDFMNNYFNLRVEDIVKGTYGDFDTFSMDYTLFIEIANKLSVIVSNEEELENALSFIKKLNNSEIQILFEKQWLTFNNSEDDIIMLREAKSVVFDESEVVKHG